MLLGYFAHDGKLDRLSTASIMTLDRFSECHHGVEAKHVDVAGEKNLPSASFRLLTPFVSASFRTPLCATSQLFP